MWVVQRSENGANQDTVSWQARGITREGACARLFLSFCPRNPVVKSPSSIGYYKSCLDSYVLYIFCIAREKERNFLLVKYSLLSTLKGFAGDPVVAGRSLFCFVLNMCSVEATASSPKNSPLTGNCPTQSACLGIHVLNTEQASTSPRCDSDRCYIRPL